MKITIAGTMVSTYMPMYMPTYEHNELVVKQVL